MTSLGTLSLQMLVQTHAKTALSMYAFVCIFASIVLVLFSEETSKYKLFENMNQYTDRSSTSLKGYGSIISKKEIPEKE